MLSNLFSRLRFRWPSALPAHRLAIAAVVKNEGPYLLEWIAFHRVVGVENFFIADNVSGDGTGELLAGLAKIGLVHYRNFASSPGIPPQLPAYRALLKEHRHRAKWIAVVDADEFLMPADEATSLHPVLDEVERIPDAGAIAVNWALYGSSGHQLPTDDLVISRFSKRSHQDYRQNHHYKSIVRASAYRDVGPNAHHFRLLQGFRYLNADKEPVVTHARGLGLSTQVVWSRCRLNHYFVKSKAEFECIKLPRGRPDELQSRSLAEFSGFDRNEVEEPVAEKLVTGTRAEMARIKAALREAGCEERLINLDRELSRKIGRPLA